MSGIKTDVRQQLGKLPLPQSIRSCLKLSQENGDYNSSTADDGKYDYMALMFTPRSNDDDEKSTSSSHKLPSIASTVESEPFQPTFKKRTGAERMFSLIPRNAPPMPTNYHKIPDAAKAEKHIELGEWTEAIASLDLALKKIPRKGLLAKAYKKACDHILMRHSFCKSNIRADAEAKHELHIRRASKMPRVAGPKNLRGRFLLKPAPRPPPQPVISPEKKQELKYMENAIVPRPKEGYFAGRLRPALQWDNEESVLRCVRHNGTWLKYADPWLKSEREVVMSAVQNEGTALRFADKYLRGDKKIGMAACKQNGWALQYYQYRGDRDVVLSAARQNGLALIFADHEFMEDEELLNLAGDGMSYRDIVLRAVKIDGSALKFAHLNIRGREPPYPEGDFEICFAAVTSEHQSGGPGSALQYCGPIMQRNRSLVMAAVEANGMALQYADPSLRNDKDILLAATQSNGLSLQFVGAGSGGILMDVRPSVVLVGGGSDPNAEPLHVFGRLGGGEFKAHVFDVLGNESQIAVQEFGEEEMKEKMKKKKRMRPAHGKHTYSVNFKCPPLPNSTTCPVALRSDQRSHLEMASFQSDSSRVRVLPPLELQGVEGHPLRADREIVISALENNGLALEFVAPRLRADFDICMIACSQNGRAIQFVDARIGRIKRKRRGSTELANIKAGLGHAEDSCGGNSAKDEGFRSFDENEDEEWTPERKRRLLNVAIQEAGFQLVIDVAPDEIIL